MDVRGQHVVYEFGEFRLDPGRQQLCSSVDGRSVALTARVFDTLLYLVENRGELVDKDRLMRAVWPDVVVEENNLAKNISILRHALGEAPDEHRFIVTVPGRGYRFVADVRTVGAFDSSVAEVLSRRSRFSFNRRARNIVFVGMLLLAAGYFAWSQWQFGGKTGAATDGLDAPTLDDIEEFLADGDWQAAFAATRLYEAANPDDPVLADLWPRFSWTTSIISDPPGATVRRRNYRDDENHWEVVGTTPIENARIPFGLSLLRFERDGYRPMERAIGGGVTINKLQLPPIDDSNGTDMRIPAHLYKLDTEEIRPEDMVRVPGWRAVIGDKTVVFRDFFLSRYEVTNREYKIFVDSGGYDRRDLWEHPFIADGQELSWEEAMALFVDRTGRPGPSTWEAGTYPDGQADYPVTGVSWYEAAAYARSVGRQLPSFYHWRRGIASATETWRLPASNLDGDGPAPVGSFDGISWIGAYDMSGNAREWVFNALGDRRLIPGGSWADPIRFGLRTEATYAAAPPMDRSPINGFRLAISRDEPDISTQARRPLSVPGKIDVAALRPVSDAVFADFRSIYAYDRAPLNASIEGSKTSRHWVRQHITFDAAYDGERMGLYLFLPTRGSPPFQTVLYWPGVSALNLDSIDDYPVHLDFILKTGRAVAFPVLKKTFSRGDRSPLPPPSADQLWRDLTIQWIQDARRTIDYLETRPDLESTRIALYGHSWGGAYAPMLLAIEPRLKAGVIYIGGLPRLELKLPPEIDPTNFASRVHVPVLLLSGEYDGVFPLDTHAKPFFELIGTPQSNKRHLIEPGGHFVPRAVLIRETLDWLDGYLGPVP